jgi:hemolysin III
MLVAGSPDPRLRVGLIAFVASAVMLFSVSALYHARAWSPGVSGLLRRLDHATIAVHIAGTSTAFALLLLEPDRAVRMLTVVWLSAALVVVLRVCWVDAPRWVHTPAFVAVGSVALLFAADFAVHSGRPALTLMLVGGVLYLVGAVVYGVQRPNPFPRSFGFHEVFHALTVVAFAAHYVGISMAAHAVT